MLTLRAPSLTVASDSGTPGDRVTNVNTPTFTGSTEANITITGAPLNGTIHGVEADNGNYVFTGSGVPANLQLSVLMGSTVLGTGSSDASGNWTLTTALLPARLYSVTLQISDISGNQLQAAATIAVSFDTTINLYAGQILVATGMANQTGQWSIAAGSLLDGVYAITAQSLDSNGSVSAISTGTAVTIKSFAATPSALALLAASGSNVQGGTISNGATPIVFGAGEAGDTLTLFDGGTAIASVTVGGNGVWQATTNPLSSGIHTLTARQTDGAGNVSGISAALTLTVPRLRFVDTGDTDASGQGDILYTDGGSLVVWLKTAGLFTQAAVANASMGAEWTAFGSADFNGDGKSDLLWTNASGQVSIWQLNGASLAQFGVPNGSMGAEWRVAGIGDFNGNRNADIFWVSAAGDATVWTMNGAVLANFGQVNGHMGAEWRVVETGDFTGDGRSDVVWESNSGDLTIWAMNGSILASLVSNVGHMGAEWHVAGVGNFNTDDNADIVWVDTGNNVQIWNMGGNGRISQIVTPAGREGSEWRLKSVGEFTGDARPDLLWLSNDGSVHLWQVNNADVVVTTPTTPANEPLLGL